jgi:PRC-barrel domain protein
MINVEHIESWRGQPVLDPAGEQLGKLEEIYLDRSSGTPLLAAIKSGLLGRRSKLVPLDGANVSRDYVRLVHDKATVDSAPEAAGDAAPDAATLDAVGAAYGLKFSERVELETSGEAEARRLEAEAARARADQLARDARDKIEARDAAHERAHGASEAATQAEREAEEARQAALAAREKAQRYDDE